jgi:hypothetical protein
MFCPTCGNEITVELKYCNRCGANLTLPTTTGVTAIAPIKLTMPSVVLAITIVSGLGIVFAGASQLAILGMHPVAVIWLTLFGTAALFGCIAMMIRFWLRVIALQRETLVAQPLVRQPPQIDKPLAQSQLPPRFEGISSVTENTTRTFSPVYGEQFDRGPK